MIRRLPRPARIAGMLALVLTGATGCARVFGSYDIAPNGLASGDDRLRRMLAQGQAVAAWERVAGDDAPADEVLRTLFRGIAAYHAGRFQESAGLFDAAAELADDRITRSISRSAFSLVANDLVLPYEPGSAERLMIPYYAALSRLHLGDVTGATVEARRLAALLQRADEAGGIPAELRGVLRYFTASVFAMAGEWNDADVAYRNAAALGIALAEPVPAHADSGTVVLVLEQGYVAHRAEQGLMVLLGPEEIDRITGGPADERAAAAARVAGRILDHAAYAARYGGDFRKGMLYVPSPDAQPRRIKRTRSRCTTRTVVASDSAGAPADTSRVRECRDVEEEVEELPYLLKVAWPVLRGDAVGAPAARLVAAEQAVDFAAGDLTRAVVEDFERERALIVARTIARGTAKLALTRGAERKLEEKSEVAGRIAGLLGNVGNVLLERADTRSWHLLPSGVSVARLQLPPGSHTLTVERGAGTTTAAAVEVVAGQVTILPLRVW